MTSATTLESQSGSQPGGLLAKLPVELRLEIYDLIFPRESVGIFAVRDRLLKAANAKVSAGDSVTILTTCRIIHDEAKPVLYANTHFDVSCSLERAPGAWRATVDAKWGEYQWLPRMVSEKSVNIQQARSIDLNIMFTVEASNKAWGNTWLDRLPAFISSVSNLKSLHIKLSTDRLLSVASAQKQADHVMPLLARLKCNGSITAAMDPSFGDKGGLDTVSYHDMLRSVGGTDKTREAYTKALAALSSTEASVQNECVTLSTQLNLKLSERLYLTTDEKWRGRLGPKIKARELLREIRSLQTELRRLRRKIDRTRARTQEVEQRQQSLLRRP